MWRRHFLMAAMAREDARAVALRLANVYGQSITDVVYTQTFSLLGRLRLGQSAAVEKILEPYLKGEKDGLAKPTASHYSGHLPFADLGGSKAKELVQRAAAMASANPLDNEMSDSVFMVCPLLVRAGMFDRAVEHFEKMQALCLRRDGLYRHSPLAEVAWGRGNAFPLLGLALTLSHFPATHAGFAQMKNAYAGLAEALWRHQRDDGMWRQVIDVLEAWPEYSCTAMIGGSLASGLAKGWISGDRYNTAVDRAWTAIQKRTGSDGSVNGVCESTGKLTSLDAYMQRKAIQGIDARGGAMGLFFATELS
jgi:unsaturated rhamnogalacturonyl hydrolase